MINIKNIIAFSLLGSIFLLSACKDEPTEPLLPLEYNAATSVYGKMYRLNELDRWETIIDLETGLFDTIPGTREAASSISFPSGTTDLTDFEGNRRIFVTSDDKNIIIQNLTSSDQISIELKDPVSGFFINRLKHLDFGATNDEIYGISSTNQPYLINVSTKTIELVHTNIPLDLDQVDAFMYLKERNDFVFFGRNHFNDEPSQYFASIYDIDTEQIIIHSSISNSFGYVKDPSSSDRIYALSLPSDDHLFRLISLNISSDNITSLFISTTDLAIDELSSYVQTIHTATNSYICRGGSTSLDDPKNNLYSIDLDSGELTNEVLLDNYGLMLGLKGE